MAETDTGTDKKPGPGTNFGTFVRKKSEAFPVLRGDFSTDPGQALGYGLSEGREQVHPGYYIKGDDQGSRLLRPLFLCSTTLSVYFVTCRKLGCLLNESATMKMKTQVKRPGPRHTLVTSRYWRSLTFLVSKM